MNQKKNRKSLFLTLLLFAIQLSVFANTIQPRWMQQPAISPNGEWIVFSYKGNLFKIKQEGGSAIQLTNEDFYSGYPIWSHDSKKIAYASNKKGNFDVYIMDASGKQQNRLTYNSSKDIPYYFSDDNQKVYFGSSRHDVYTSVRYPLNDMFMKLYEVSAKGSSSRMVNGTGMEFAHYNKAKDAIVFQDNKGSIEDPYRKHALSSITRDIWVYKVKTQTYTKVSNFKGEDREPLWGKGEDIYYLSEKNGSQNLYRTSLSDPAKMVQLTNFEKHPVRSISKAVNGKFTFTYNGDIYTLEEGNQPVKLSFTIADISKDIITPITLNNGSKDMDVSYDGKQVAFISRGDVYVTSPDGTTTKRITSTPYQERMIQFSPDGRKLLFSVEHNGSWDIDEITMTDKSQNYFYLATNLDRQTIISGNKDDYQGVYSPDGKKIAYLEERSILKTYDLATKTFHTLLPAGINYSQRDGDQYFTWSPDSKYLIVKSTNFLLIKDDAIAKRVTISQSVFESTMPHWGSNSKVMYSLSAANGLSNFTRSDSQYDIVKTFFDNDEWYSDKFGEEEFTSRNPSEIDLTNGNFNSKRITNSSANILDIAISNDDKKVYFLGRYENNYDLYLLDIASGEIKLFAKIDAQNPKMKMSQDGSTIYVVGNGNKFQRINVDDGKVTALKINLETDVNETQERNYVFDHLYNIIKDKFLDPKLNGVDFDFYYANYKEFLPFINNNEDFRKLISEFLGELNNSHLFSAYWPYFSDTDETAALGLLYDNSRNGDGLLVKEIITDGPFDNGRTKLKSGMIIDKIDGNQITVKEDWAKFLNNKANTIVKIDFHDSKTGMKYQETIKPIDSYMEAENLMYNRWKKQMEHLTDSLSGGKIGYVHIRGMEENSYRDMYDKVLGSYADKQALIVDTRYNNGGSLTGELVTFLAGKVYLTERRNGILIDSQWPENKWTKPSCVVMNESNYSDAFLFPYVYRNLGIGKLIGMPVPGTGTGSVGERQLIPGLGVGIPARGVYGIGEKHPTENHQIEPDILINNEYAKILSGSDQQIEVAIKELLNEN